MQEKLEKCFFKVFGKLSMLVILDLFLWLNKHNSPTLILDLMVLLKYRNVKPKWYQRVRSFL